MKTHCGAQTTFYCGVDSYFSKRRAGTHFPAELLSFLKIAPTPDHGGWLWPLLVVHWHNKPPSRWSSFVCGSVTASQIWDVACHTCFWYRLDSLEHFYLTPFESDSQDLVQQFARMSSLMYWSNFKHAHRNAQEVIKASCARRKKYNTSSADTNQ